jgi:hypothetical protein
MNMTKYQQKFAESLEPVIGVQSLALLETSERAALEERALQRITRRDVERQRNIERIVGLAADESPEVLNDTSATRDWLNQFIEYAQDINDETSQQVWARMLANYIANPESVNKRSLIALHGMDVWEVKAFIEYCSFAFLLENGWRFVFEEAITRREMWGYVQGQDYTQHFINIGLLAQEQHTVRPRSVRSLKIRYFNKEYELVLPEDLGTRGDGLEIGYGYRKFSPIGQQISKAIKARIYHGYARNLIRTLDAQRNVQFRLLETEDTYNILPTLSGVLQPAT